MAELPETLLEAWNNRKGPAVFTTVNSDSVPNSIYVGCMTIHNSDTVLIADNYFDKTRKNLLAGTQGAFLFITNKGTSYQIKGRVEYHTEGELFDDMKTWNPEKHPGRGAAAIRVEEVYSGADKLL
mgnify:CR=1 FL=1